jgi:hypothetical protein
VSDWKHAVEIKSTRIEYVRSEGLSVVIMKIIVPYDIRFFPHLTFSFNVPK